MPKSNFTKSFFHGHCPNKLYQNGGRRSRNSGRNTEAEGGEKQVKNYEFVAWLISNSGGKKEKHIKQANTRTDWIKIERKV